MSSSLASQNARPLTIIITGGSAGIGLSCLKKLLQKPVPGNVVSVSRSTTPELESLMKLYPSQLKVLNGDVRDDQTNRKAVELAIQSFSSIDGLILNAGKIDFKRLDHQPHEELLNSFKEIFEINFYPLVSILNHSIDHLRQSFYLTQRRSKVIFVSSGSAVNSYASTGAYNSSKAAMNSLCKTLSNEESNHITSISIRPGVVDTNMQTQVRELGKQCMNPNDHSRFIQLFESSKLLQPEQPAEIIANLISHPMTEGDHKTLSGQFLSWDDELLKPYRSDPSFQAY